MIEYMWQRFIYSENYILKLIFLISLRISDRNTHQNYICFPQKSDDHKGRQCSGSGSLVGTCISTTYLCGTGLVIVFARLWNWPRWFITENLSRSWISNMMFNIDVVLSKLHRHIENFILERHNLLKYN